MTRRGGTVRFTRRDGTVVEFGARTSRAFAPCDHCGGTGMVEYAEGPHEWEEPCRHCEAGRDRAESFDYRACWHGRSAAYSATYRW